MGRDVLKFPRVVLGNPSNFHYLMTLLIIFVGVVSVDADDARIKMFTDIYPPRILNASQLNISQNEYETKHREFFDLVEQNQRQRLTLSSSYDEESIVTKKLYTFTHSGLRNSIPPVAGVIRLNYNVDIPEETNKYIEVEEASLRVMIVPKRCGAARQKHHQQVALKIVRINHDRVLKKEKITLDSCLPKWIGLDLTDVYYLNAKSKFKVSIHCEQCSKGLVEFVDPHLNIIANVKPKVRTKRADRKKRRRFQGRCVRHPWEVDLGKLKGYEFIIQPRKFDAGLCAGKCTSHKNLATQHSNLQFMFSNIDKTIPKPCCAPIKMESLEVLYPDDLNPKKLKISVWNNTKIVECACA